MPDFRSPYAQTIIQLFNQLVERGYEPSELEQVRDGWLTARKLFACRVMGSGKIFLSHTIGAASVLASLKSRPALVVAGLLHNAYENGRFKDGGRGATPARRSTMRALVGEDAEAVMYRFVSVAWNAHTLEGWLDKNTLDDGERDLLALRLADAIDHATSLGLAYAREPVNFERFEKITEAMDTLARRHGFTELADAWSNERECYQSGIIPLEVYQESPVNQVFLPRSYRGNLMHKLRRIRSRANS